jgi:hypothetical protein
MTGMLLLHALITMAYVWKGKRSVVVCAGGHGKVDGSRLGGAVIAFAVD